MYGEEGVEFKMKLVFIYFMRENNIILVKKCQ